MIDSIYQGEIGLLLYKEYKEEYVRNPRGPLGDLLVLLCPVNKVNGKPQQPNSGRTTSGPDPSGIKVRVSLLGKKS